MKEILLQAIKEEQQRADKFFQEVLVLAGIQGKLEHVAENESSRYSKDVQAFASDLLHEIESKLEALK